MTRPASQLCSNEGPATSPQPAGVRRRGWNTLPNLKLDYSSGSALVAPVRAADTGTGLVAAAADDCWTIDWSF